MAIIELIFIILKTIILSTIYASIVLLFLLLSNAILKQQWITNILQRKIKFWLVLHLLIAVFLFCFRFTYWQDTGIGDYNCIPIGFNQKIENEDFEVTYFQPSENDTAIEINQYAIFNNTLCATVNNDFSNSTDFDFIVYDIPKGELFFYRDKEAYEIFASEENLPMTNRFYSFKKHFEVYLKQRPFWRKWLVP